MNTERIKNAITGVMRRGGVEPLICCQMLKGDILPSLAWARDGQKLRVSRFAPNTSVVRLRYDHVVPFCGVVLEYLPFLIPSRSGFLNASL